MSAVCTRSMKVTSNEYNINSISQTLVFSKFPFSWTKFFLRWILLLCNLNPDFSNLRTSRSTFCFPRRLEETVFYSNIKMESSFFQALKCYQTIVSPVLAREMVKVSGSFYQTLSLLAFISFSYRRWWLNLQTERSRFSTLPFVHCLRRSKCSCCHGSLTKKKGGKRGGASFLAFFHWLLNSFSCLSTYCNSLYFFKPQFLSRKARTTIQVKRKRSFQTLKVHPYQRRTEKRYVFFYLTLLPCYHPHGV